MPTGKSCTRTTSSACFDSGESVTRRGSRGWCRFAGQSDKKGAVMKYFRIATLALLAPCAALANLTEDVHAVGGAVIPSLGVSIDLVGDSKLQSHRPGLSHSIDIGFAYARAKHRQDVD